VDGVRNDEPCKEASSKGEPASIVRITRSEQDQCRGKTGRRDACRQSHDELNGRLVHEDHRTFMTMEVRSSYCSASPIQFFISAEIRALISLAER